MDFQPPPPILLPLSLCRCCGAGGCSPDSPWRPCSSRGATCTARGRGAASGDGRGRTRPCGARCSGRSTREGRRRGASVTSARSAEYWHGWTDGGFAVWSVHHAIWLDLRLCPHLSGGRSPTVPRPVIPESILPVSGRRDQEARQSQASTDRAAIRTQLEACPLSPASSSASSAPEGATSAGSTAAGQDDAPAG